MPYGVTNTIFRADWLRGVDQGIGADFLGNLFCLIMEKLLGTKERKSNALWLGIQRDYYIHEVQDKLPTVSHNSVGLLSDKRQSSGLAVLLLVGA